MRSCVLARVSDCPLTDWVPGGLVATDVALWVPMMDPGATPTSYALQRFVQDGTATLDRFGFYDMSWITPPQDRNFRLTCACRWNGKIWCGTESGWIHGFDDLDPKDLT